MSEQHFINTPITIEWFCDDCQMPVVYQKPRIKAVGNYVAADQQGFRHICPSCGKEWTFPIKLPVLQHLKIAPIMPSKLYLSEHKDEN